MEHIIVNPNAAYDKFKDKRVGTKGLGEPKLKLDRGSLEDKHVEWLLSSDISGFCSRERVPHGDLW